jgi:peptide/nickel transport system substrate-binding protein
MMRPYRLTTACVLATLLALPLLSGCTESADNSGGGTTGKGDSQGGDEPSKGGDSGKTPLASWPEYSDVPFVPVMSDVDGIDIPRVNLKAETLSLKGIIPADVGNDFAGKNPSKPETGGRLIVRFNSEPKSLNPIVETSAVQTYIGQYVNEALAWQNPETLEFEPHIAERWVAEDSVKLSSDYKGRERRVAIGDGEPAGELSIEYKAAKKDDDPATLKFTTSDTQGKAVGGVWVGLYPDGKVPGAPTAGYHYWSKGDGSLAVSGIVPGKYKAKVGDELFGVTKENEDGSLSVTPKTPGNPLAADLKSGEAETLTIPKGEWVDVQRETIYTYFLRPDVKWSDGSPFTTKDLLFAYATINNQYVDGESLRVYYEDVIECDALDDVTIRLKYRRQYFKSFEFTMGLAAYTPSWNWFSNVFKEDGNTLTLERLTPAQEKAQKKVSVHGQTFGKFFNTDDRYNSAPLGTGPYTVELWERSDRVELQRNPNYWNKERGGYIDRFVFKFIPDNVTALQALRAGELDFFWNLTPGQYFEDLKGPPPWVKDKYVKAAWYSPGFSYYGWNMLKPLFKDRRVRIALSLLFDKQEFLEKKLHGAGVVVAGSQYYFGTVYDHEVKPLGYDPNTAADLLAEAGWVDTDNDGILDRDGKKFEFTLIFPPGNPSAAARAAVIQKNYKQAGIKMEIRNFEWASFIDKVKAKDYDAVNLGWAQPLESDPFQIWHGSQAGPEKRGSNHVSFSDPLADQLIEQLRLTLDLEKRKKINASLQRIIDREQPYMFLYASKAFGVYHQRVRGVKWYRVRPGFDLTEWYIPKAEQQN